MREISLTKSKIALVDNEDFEYLSQFKWFVRESGRDKSLCYASRNVSIKNGAHRKFIHMHRVIMDAPANMKVDHINGDGLDNRKFNLRLSSQRQNLFNSRIRSDNTSGYKGVGYFKAQKIWRAYIRQNDKYKHIGYFNSAYEAAIAYDHVAREIFGEFAKTNFDLEENVNG